MTSPYASSPPAPVGDTDRAAETSDAADNACPPGSAGGSTDPGGNEMAQDHHIADPIIAAGNETRDGAGALCYSISDLASDFGVTTRAIRFYESKNLITPERRGTARLYSRRDRARLQMILRGKNLGFSLEEIREFLDLYDADPTQTLQTRHLLGKVDEAISELENKRADIERTLGELSQIRSQCLDHLARRNRDG